MFAPRRGADLQVGDKTGILQWPNGADFDPETLRNWPRYRDEFAQMARRWSVRQGR